MLLVFCLDSFKKMASKDEKYLDFDEILKRGSATEPRNFRPVPLLPDGKENLSLNGEVKKVSKVGKKGNLPMVCKIDFLIFHCLYLKSSLYN